jgi:hemoglobin
MQSLFEKLGGISAVDTAVDLFYDKVLSDERIKHFFAHTDMARQRAHQKAFLTVAFGGPNAYEGRDMRAGHARLVSEMGLSDIHFDAVVENLANTLREMGVAETLIGEVGAVAETVRCDVLGR